VYDFVLDAPGTFWYHSHSSVQYMDGLRAALVATDPYALAPYGEGGITHSPVFFTHDWNWMTTAQLLPLVNAGNPENVNVQLPQSVLVNGWGQTPKCMQAGTCRVPVIRGAAGTCDDPKTLVRFIGASGNVSSRERERRRGERERAGARARARERDSFTDLGLPFFVKGYTQPRIADMCI
jgi:hypothetical protein